MKLNRFSKLILTGLLLAAGSVSAAVNKGNITGKVVDKLSNQPLPFVAITLGMLPDTIIKKTVQTDDKGNYAFNQVADGRYVVSAYMVGYSRRHSNTVVCRQNTVRIEPLVMENTIIREVTVTGKRPEIELKADRTVVNVENSTTASADNAYEVLRKAPGVNIDKDDNISLKGKDGVLVTINDKPTYLSGQELASYLKSLNGTEIEKVELITTPPARYEAAGNTGIINIKLKRNSAMGVNGSANVGAVYTGKVSEYGGLSLNMRKGKLSTFGSINGRNSYYKNSLDSDRHLKGDTSLILQRSKTHGHVQSFSYRVGADYELNRRHTIGVMARGSVSEYNSTLNANTSLLLKDGLLGKALRSTTESESNNQNISLNANYRMTIDTNGRTLNVDVDYVRYCKGGTEYNDIYYFGPTGTPIGNPLLLRNHTPSDITIKSFRADYVHPFSKETILEAGIKGSMVKSDNDLQYERSLDAKGTYADDRERSNHFKFDENIAAAYTSIAFSSNGWNLKGGLRAEHTWNKGHQVTIDSTNKRHYIDLFPTLFIQRSINEKNSLGISYTRRIDRPNYSKLNPFVWRIDEYSYMGGNPMLKPQYSDNIEVNHSWNSCIFSSIGYSYTNNVQTRVAEEVIVVKPTNGTGPSQAIKAVKLSEQNLKGLSSLTLNVSANFTPVKWLRTNNNITATYDEYSRASNQSGNSSVMYQFYSSNSIILPKQCIFEVMGWYRSATASGMIDMDAQYIVCLGIQKKFLNEQLSLRVGFDDVFHTINNKSWAKYDNMDIYYFNKWDSQKVNISLTYHFGSKDVKQASQRTTSLEEEQKRTGN